MLEKAVETGLRHLQKELGLQLMPTTMQARATMRVLHAPAARPEHGARHRLAGAAAHGAPWTICSHHMVHAEMQIVEGIAKSMTKAAAVKVDQCALAGKFEIRAKNDQPVHDVTARNLKIGGQGGHRLRHAGTVAVMTTNTGLLGSRVLFPRRWPRSIPHC